VFSHNTAKGQKQRRRVCFVQFARWRHWGEVCRLQLHIIFNEISCHCRIRIASFSAKMPTLESILRHSWCFSLNVSKCKEVLFLVESFTKQTFCNIFVHFLCAFGRNISTVVITLSHAGLIGVCLSLYTPVLLLVVS